jgi:acetyl esterase/lipase
MEERSIHVDSVEATMWEQSLSGTIHAARCVVDFDSTALAFLCRLRDRWYSSRGDAGNVKERLGMPGRRAKGAGVAMAMAGGWLWSRRARTFHRLHPELRSPWLRIRTPSTSPLVVKAMRVIPSLLPRSGPEGVEHRRVPGPAGSPDVNVYISRPQGASSPLPAELYIPGGGFMIGSAGMFHDACARFARAGRRRG